MRKLLFIALVALLAVGCKTTEANYRAAYEATMAQRQENSGIDSTIYARIRNSAQTSTLVVGTDSLPMRTEHVGIAKDGGITPADLRRYNVVVGQFKQIFNAQQMRERLMASGYDHTFLLQTREPLYYVVTATSDSPEEILREWNRVKDDASVVLRSPLPFILRPASKAR